MQLNTVQYKYIITIHTRNVFSLILGLVILLPKPTKFLTNSNTFT